MWRRWLKSIISDDIFHLNSLAPGRSECDSKNVIFNIVLLIGIFRSSYDNATGPYWWYVNVNIGSCNRSVLSGNKPLTEPMLTQFLVALWCHQATMS